MSRRKSTWAVTVRRPALYNGDAVNESSTDPAGARRYTGGLLLLSAARTVLRDRPVSLTDEFLDGHRVGRVRVAGWDLDAESS